MNIKSLFVKLLIGIVPFITGCSNLPVKVPIDLSKEGDTVEFEAIITKADHYQFMLYFYFSQREKDPEWKSNPEWKKTPAYQEYKKEFDALYDFVGTYERGKYTGQTIPIRLMIYKINKKDRELISDEIYDRKIENALVMNSTGYLYRFRWFASYDFERGKYLIRVENIKGFEFMKNRRSDVVLLRYRPKV
jgi:hypothetical protein